VKPSHLKTSRFPIARLGCLTAVLLGLATLCQPSLANAADDSSAGAHVQSSRVEPGASPEVAAGGTIVLRGSRSAVAPNTNPPSTNPPNTNPGAPNRNGEGYVSSNNAPAAALSPSVGWDRDLDVSGFDNGVPVPLTGTMGR
jgi:hypothetical protein